MTTITYLIGRAGSGKSYLANVISAQYPYNKVSKYSINNETYWSFISKIKANGCSKIKLIIIEEVNSDNYQEALEFMSRISMNRKNVNFIVTTQDKLKIEPNRFLQQAIIECTYNIKPIPCS